MFARVLAYVYYALTCNDYCTY